MQFCGALAATGILCVAPSIPSHAQPLTPTCERKPASEVIDAPLRPGILCGLAPPREGSWEESRPSSEKAFLLSLLVPGAGQRSLGQKRGWAYFALEAIAWVEFARARHDGGALRDDYRTLGWDVARTFEGARVDGDFRYYETLTKFARSGAFDANPNARGLQPELDPSTFNGSIWALATDIFLAGNPPPEQGDPNFERALDFYRERGYGERFLWDWTGNEASRRKYGDLIQESDSRFRRASLMTGVLLGNHLVSSLDAFLSARLVRKGGLT